MNARIDINALPNEPLKLSDIRKGGFADLKAYVKALHNESKATSKREFENLPLCTFSTFYPKTGATEVKLTCQDYSDLPTSDVEGVYLND